MKMGKQMFVVAVMVGLALTVSYVALADIPLMINHQGLVKVDGGPFTGPGYFKFGFLDSTTSTWLWTNDGSHIGDPVSTVPDTPVTVPVNYGVYNVRLGDTTLTGMTAIPSSVFDSDDVKLRVIFDDGVNLEEVLSPDQQITSAAYAYHALNADRADVSIPSIFGVFCGDGSDGDVTVSANIDFSSLTGSIDDFFLQADNLTIDTGATLTVDTGWAYVGVKGTCTIHGTIDASGQGEHGGSMCYEWYGYCGASAEGFGGATTYQKPGGDVSSGVVYLGSAGAISTQLSVPFAVSGAGGGGGSHGGYVDPNYGGAGGGAGGPGGCGVLKGHGSNATPTPAKKTKTLSGGSMGNNTTHGYSHFLPFIIQFRGAGGGSGIAPPGGEGGAGGNGGGVIYIECDVLVFDGTLVADGADGLGGDTGGGGGGGGVIFVRAKSVTANTGTVTVMGGSGSTQGGGYGGNGADGFKDIIQVK